MTTDSESHKAALETKWIAKYMIEGDEFERSLTAWGYGMSEALMYAVDAITRKHGCSPDMIAELDLIEAPR